MIRKILSDGTVEYYLALLTSALIPLYHWYLTPVFVLWGFIFIINIPRFINDFRSGENLFRILLLLFLAFYFWQILGLIYSSNLKDGIRNISLRLPILLFPLVLIFPGEKIKNKIEVILKAFTISTFIYFLICLIYAIYRSVDYSDGIWSFNPHPQKEVWLNYFFASELAIFQHPSYLSMYAIFASFIGLELALRKALQVWKRLFWIFISLSLLVETYLLSSRAAILALLICILVYVAIKIFHKKIPNYKYIFVILFASAIIVFLVSNPRVKNLSSRDSNNDVITKALTESRISIWKVSINLISKNLLLGVGTGDIQDSLNDEYLNTGNAELTKVPNLNTHNQYIEILTENGLVGLILFISIIYSIFRIAFANRSSVFLVYIFLIIVSILFETMLNRLAGLSFISFFSCLLLHYRMERL